MFQNIQQINKMEHNFFPETGKFPENSHGCYLESFKHGIKLSHWGLKKPVLEHFLKSWCTWVVLWFWIYLEHWCAVCRISPSLVEYSFVIGLMKHVWMFFLHTSTLKERELKIKKKQTNKQTNKKQKQKQNN